MNSENILFYLSTCDTCTNLRLIMQKYNLLINFKLICIDNNKKYYINKGLQKVPSIILKGSSNIIDGGQCMNWVNNIISTINANNKQKMMDSYNNPYNINNMNKKEIRPPPLIQNNKNNQENTQKNLDGYNDIEMNGVSDNYAYRAEDNNNPFPKNYQPKNLNTEIFTPPIEKSKIKKNMQEELTKKISIIRNNDMQEFKKNR